MATNVIRNFAAAAASALVLGGCTTHVVELPQPDILQKVEPAASSVTIDGGMPSDQSFNASSGVIVPSANDLSRRDNRNILPPTQPVPAPATGLKSGANGRAGVGLVPPGGALPKMQPMPNVQTIQSKPYGWGQGPHQDRWQVRANGQP
jgi:hypothetical protein